MTRTRGGFVVLVSLVMASAALAQPAPPAVCGLDPYVYAGIGPRVKCWTATPDGSTQTPVAPTVYKFGEGVVHAPGSELAWVILANFDETPQGVELEYIITGAPYPVWRHYTVPAHARYPVPVHEDAEFAGLATFNVRVFWPGDGDAQLVMRPASDPFSRATIPAPAVTSGKFYTSPEEH